MRLEGNKANYGDNIASGIAELISSASSIIMTRNRDPLNPQIRVSIKDHYGNIVRRRNDATTVVATVFSVKCMYRPMPKNCTLSDAGIGIPKCHNCPTSSQSLSGKPAQEIPGLDGSVNFTGLGVRAWPGNHTLRLEIDGIKPLLPQFMSKIVGQVNILRLLLALMVVSVLRALLDLIREIKGSMRAPVVLGALLVL